MESIERFIRLLKKSPSGAVFNPWWQIDDENDIDPHSPGIRRKHLAVYFRERFGNARLARNLFESAVACQASRIVALSSPSDRQLQSLTARDVNRAAAL